VPGLRLAAGSTRALPGGRIPGLPPVPTGYPALVHRDAALLRLELPDRPEAPSAARKALAALNGSFHLISVERMRDVQLLASELVANAVRHGGRPGAPVAVTVWATPRAMRVEVSDQGDGFDPDRLRAPARTRNGGWGLPIASALADRWGVDRGAATTVWYEIDRSQQRAPLAAAAR
jgi:anti-sigma regulatory factor (Ser/Thr protein kinase)